MWLIDRSGIPGLRSETWGTRICFLVNTPPSLGLYEHELRLVGGTVVGEGVRDLDPQPFRNGCDGNDGGSLNSAGAVRFDLPGCLRLLPVEGSGLGAPVADRLAAL